MDVYAMYCSSCMDMLHDLTSSCRVGSLESLSEPPGRERIATCRFTSSRRLRKATKRRPTRSLLEAQKRESFFKTFRNLVDLRRIAKRDVCIHACDG